MSSKVQNLAPTDGIKDPQVRAFAESLSNAWQLRNGSIGADDKQRFVTKEEWDFIAKNPNIRALAGIGQPGSSSGESGPGDDISGGGGAIQLPPMIQNLVDFLASGITLYDFTNVYRTSNELLANVYALTSKARADMGAIWAAIEQLNTIVVGPDSATAEAIRVLAAQVADNLAMIEQIEFVEATSASVNARTLKGQQVMTGFKSRVFVQPTAPTLVTGTPPNDYTLKVNDLWIDTDSVPHANMMFRWDGTGWVDASDARLAFSSAGITTESITRATHDSALAQQLNKFWAQVGNNTALVIDDTIVEVNPGAGNAEKFLAVQASVSDANGNVYSAASEQKFDDYVILEDEKAHAGYSLKVQATGGTPPVQAIGGMVLTADVLNGQAQTNCVFLANNFAIYNDAPDPAPGTESRVFPPFLVTDGKVRMNTVHIARHIRSDEFYRPGEGGRVDGWGWKINKNGDAEFYGTTTLARVLSGSTMVDRNSGEVISTTASSAWTLDIRSGIAVQSNSILRFWGPDDHKTKTTNIYRRIRDTTASGINLATTVQFIGVADDRITLWRRYRGDHGGTWEPLTYTSTPTDNYNAATCSWVGHIGCGLNGYWDFGVSPTDNTGPPGAPYNGSAIDLKAFTLSVTISNL